LDSAVILEMPKEPGRILKVCASASMNAAPECVYATIADYYIGHPRILPKQFSGMVVESGGIGAGTIVRFNMRVFGRTQAFCAAVSEPQAGRVLVETYLAAAVLQRPSSWIQARRPDNPK